MAPRHWQIMKYDGNGRTRYGKVEAIDLAQAPARVVRTAMRAAALIGDGLYGVDLKTVGAKTYVVEVNDNPSIEAGCEDGILKEALYESIMRFFLKRLEAGQQQRTKR